MSKPTILLTAALAFLLSACAGTFRYGNETFNSEAEALAAQQKKMAAYVAEISPTTQRVGGTLRMYVPNQEVGREVFITGNRASALADYLLKVRYGDIKYLNDAVTKRAIFDKVELKYDKGEHRGPEPDAYVMYLYASRDGQIVNAGWYFVGTRVPRTPLNVDSGELGSKRLLPLLDSLEGLARVEKSSK